MSQARSVLLLLLLAPLAPASAPPPSISDAHDLIVLHKARPYRLRLHLRFKGQSFQVGWHKQVDRLFTFLDANGDGVLSKKEASHAPSLTQWRQMTQGRGEIDPDAPPRFADLASRDGNVTRQSVVDFYRKATGGPLQIDWGKRHNPAADPLSESLFDLLGAKRSGRLTSKQLLGAFKTLSPRDQNGDELISGAELLGLNFYQRPNPTHYEGRAHGPSPVELPFFSRIPGYRDDQLLDKIFATYDRNKDKKLTPREIRLPNAMFTRLDRDKNGVLDRKELACWLDEAPDVHLRLTLDAIVAPIKVLGKPTVRLDKGPLGSLKITLPGMCLDINVSAAGLTAPAVVKRDAVTLFNSLDANKDGWLTDKEVARPPFTYVALMRLADRNGDDKVSRKEFVAFMDLQSRLQSVLSFLYVADGGTSLFSMLDTNSDGLLSQREMQSAAKVLAPWMKNGRLSKADLPRHYHFRVRQVSPLLAQGGFQGDPRNRFPVIVRPALGPVWFQKMDRNGDGDVSRQEWLGSRAQFDKIDTDKDGLISLDEAIKADAKARNAKK